MSERPLKLYASRWNEGEVSVPECTGRVTNEGRRTTVSASSISTARSRLDGQTKPAGGRLLGGDKFERGSREARTWTERHKRHNPARELSELPVYRQLVRCASRVCFWLRRWIQRQASQSYKYIYTGSALCRRRRSAELWACAKGAPLDHAVAHAAPRVVALPVVCDAESGYARVRAGRGGARVEIRPRGKAHQFLHGKDLVARLSSPSMWQDS